jgi:small subunit ribosomal protein S16
MLKIRLKRIGRKKKPFYKVVVMENLSKRDGESLADLGYYDPINKKALFNLPLIHYYLKNGAYPTDTTRLLLKRNLLKFFD